MLLMPLGAWAQTTYQGGGYGNGSWGDWTVTSDNPDVVLSSSGSSLSCYVPVGETSTIQLSLTQTTSEKLCALTYSASSSGYSLLSAKIMSSDGQTEITDLTSLISTGSFSATTPIEWGEGEKLVLTCQYVNESSTAQTKLIFSAKVTTGTPYDLVVNGITVTTANKDCVTGGTTNWNGETYVSIVSFDPTDGNKLNLCKADLSGPIQLGSSISSLTIDINGNCAITTTDAAISAESAASITFTTSSTGSLNLKRNDGTGLVGSNISLSYNPGLSAVIVAPTSASTLADATEANIIDQYNIIVAGVQVTEDNAGNITGDNISGTVSYNPNTKTLTLDGASITTSGNDAIISSIDNLTVILKGENTITCHGDYDDVFKGAISGAKVTFDVDYTSSGNLTIYAPQDYLFDGITPSYATGLSITHDGNDHHTIGTTSYGLTIAGIPVTSQNAGGITGDGITGTVTYNADQHALTLEGATIAGSIEVTNENNLTINVIGTNSISSGTSSALKSKAGGIPGPTITFVKAGDGDCSLALSSTNVTVISTQFGGLNYTNLALVTDVEGDVSYDYQFSGLSYYDSQSQTTLPITSALITSYTTYGITVGGVAVTSLNASNITGDNIVAYQDGDYSVTYDAESNTLSLANARVASGGISSTSNAALNVSLNGSVVLGSSTVNGISCAGDLSISAVGTNIIFYPVVSTKDGEATLTLQNGSDADSKLTLNYQGSESGFAAVVYDGLYLSAENPRALKFSPSRQRFEESADAWASTIIFSNAKTYELWLGATKVTEANKANILGTEEPTATFDPDENILTLNGMTLIGTNISSDGIISRLPNLTISVNGANMITCSDSCSVIRADMEGAQTLTILKGSDGCSLTLDGSRVIRDFKTLTVTGLSWNDNNFTYQYDTSLPNFNNGYRLMKADGEEASKNYDTGFKPALYDESVETYDLWVAGVQVTSANADAIQGSYIDGSVSFDVAKNVLTFERATIDLKNVYMGIPVASGIADLTVNLVDYNTITPNINNPFFAKYTGEAGAAPTLTFDTEGFMDDGIYWLGSLTLNNLEEIGSVANGYEFDLEESPENVYPQDAGAATTGWKVSVNTDDVNPYVKVWRLEVFDLWIGDGRVISSDIRGGKDNAPYYNPVTDRLVCYDNCEYPIISSMPALTVEIDGECTIAPTTSSPAISFQEREDVTSGTLTFVRADDAQSASITLTANGENNSSEPYKAIEGFSAANITVGEGLFLKSHATMAEALEATTVTIGDPTGYALYIGDTQVTDVNADDVLGDGKVSFTVSGGQEAAPTYMLTLNGAALTAPVKVGLANLTFDIRGNNTITTNTTCIQNTATTGVPSLTFKSNADVVGSLTLTNNSDETDDGVISSSFYSNNTSYYTISKELALIILRNGEYTFNTYYFTAGEVHNVQFVPSYGVQIGETQIYEGNAADVFGDGTVSFDKSTNTLTLNGASAGALCTSLAELTVELVGNNTLSEGGSYPVLRSLSGDAVIINVQSTADVMGTLTMNMPYTQAGKFCENQVTLNIVAPLEVVSGSLTGNDGNNNTVVIGPNYGITITSAGSSYPITSDNRLDVLGDGGSVQFDGKNTLILNNAKISSVILGADDSWVKKGLTIYLKDDNTIGEQDGLIYQGQGANVPLTFATGDVEPGTLTLSYSDQPLYCFNTTYLNNLTETLDPGHHTMTIAVSMKPFVTHSGEEKTEDGGGVGLGQDIEHAGTSTLTAGILVNKILYTLPDVADGFLLEDGKKVVEINSSMTDADANRIMAAVIDGSLLPGTPEFAAEFHGMTFLLPAGNGDIILDVNTNEAGELHVKVGNNDPVVISATTGFEERRVPYALTEASYVFIYNVTSAPSSSRRSAGHRAPGRKETTTVGIKGLSVSASDVSPAPGPALSPKKLDKSLMIKEGNHITVNDMDIEDIEVDAFDELSGDITYVDLRQTSIKGMSVNRMLSDDLFKKLPEKTFIYLPAGNEVITGTKNVVVGSVCNDMELDAAAPFEASKDFVAVKAVHARDFSTMLDKHCTVYLPFALDEEQASSLGTFYEMTGIADGKIMFTSVKETKANMPYMFKPAKETVSAKMVEVKATIPGAPVVGSATFEGTYNQKSILSDASTQYYCFKAEDGKLVHVIDNSMTVDPFRCYIKVTGGASLGRFLDIVVDDETTAVKNIKVGSEDNVYYDLSGRRVLYPKKGMYIMNGKKVIIK